MDSEVKKPHVFVKETTFGDWFINTDMWKVRVIGRALKDLLRLIPPHANTVETVIDVGCGFGHCFQLLYDQFKPNKIIGLDADPDIQVRAGKAASECASDVTLMHTSANNMQAIADASVDIVFCHQAFHHIVEQEAAMQEFFRVLKPKGLLLFAESTKYYINTLQIRLFFRHPMHVQKSAEEYVEVIREAGFDLPASRVSMPFLWWSRPDCGMMEWLGFPLPKKRNETLVNAVAVKP